MDLQKMAFEFAESLMEAIRSATLEELAGPSTVRTWPSMHQAPAKRSPAIQLVRAGTGSKLLMNTGKPIAKPMAVSLKKQKPIVAKKPAAKVAKKAASLKKAAKRSHKKKAAAQAKKGARS